MADEHQPTFYIPDKDITVTYSKGGGSNVESFGYNAITGKTPYLTVYLWTYNGWRNDSKWRTPDNDDNKGPAIIIDGTWIYLKCLNNLKSEDDIKSAKWGQVYTDADKKYYVFIKDVFKFDEVISGFPDNFDKDANERESDYYAVVEIAVTKETVGKTHEIKVYGGFENDTDSPKYVYAKDIVTNNTSAETQQTVSPFHTSEYSESSSWLNYKAATFNTHFHTIEGAEMSIENKTPDVVKVETSSTPGNSAIDYKMNLTFNNDQDVTEPKNVNIDYVFNKALTDWGSDIKVEIRDTVSKVITPEPKTINLTTEFNQWEKKVLLTWNVENSTSSTKGKYVVLRDNNQIAEVELSKLSDKEMSYTDEKPEYDKEYTYNVNFLPEDWTTEMFNGGSLEKKTTVSTQRNLSMNLTAQGGDTKNTLNWTADTQVENGTFVVYRSESTLGSEEGSWNSIAEIKVTTPGKEFSYDDPDIKSISYSYKVVLKSMSTEFSSNVAYVNATTYPTLSYLRATRGSYSDKVRLEWGTNDIKAADRMIYHIFRRVLGTTSWVNCEINSFSSANSVVTYDDVNAVPGIYYEYGVRSVMPDDDTKFSQLATDGFVRSSGTISGTITFDKSQGVDSVKVNLVADGDANESQFRALQLKDGTGGLVWTPSNVNTLKNIFTGAGQRFTVQMYVRPDAGNTKDEHLIDLGATFKVMLTPADGAYALKVMNGTDTETTPLTIPAAQYTHLTLSHNENNKLTLSTIGLDGMIHSYTLAADVVVADLQNNKMTIGCDNTNANSLTGCLDDVRVFNKVLADKDILRNYNHTLSGTESGLVAYWTFDENADIVYAYDWQQNCNNTADIVGAKRTSQQLPTKEQLSLYGLTDNSGRYTIQGIPLIGENTYYKIVPTKGQHEFEPLVSGGDAVCLNARNLTFKDVSFLDKSSFTVSGKVYFEYTDYPVSGCQFYVDGALCTMNNKTVLTNGDGDFTIQVPIGAHTISIEREGHSFLDGGKYANTFTRDITGLKFFDTTKTKVVGRVAGGVVQGNKPLGFGKSKANVGSAIIELSASTSAANAAALNVLWIDGLPEGNTNDRAFKNALTYENDSKAYVPKCDYNNTEDGDRNKYLYIQTDSKTGEFAAYLPPIQYVVNSITMAEGSSASFSQNQLLPLDASDVLTVYTDTLRTYGEGDDADKVMNTEYYDYNVAYKATYRSVPKFAVHQTSPVPLAKNAFGENTLIYYPEDVTKDSVNVNTYSYALVEGTTDEYAVTDYTLGYPVFQQDSLYTYEFEGYEEYSIGTTNDIVMLANTEVSITNPMANLDTVVELNTNDHTTKHETQTFTVMLDKEGRGSYSFTGFLPNITEGNLLTTQIFYKPEGYLNPIEWEWSEEHPQLTSYLLGVIPMGNDVLSAAGGFDELINVVRDPYGSNSFATWQKGTTANIHGSISIQADTEINADLARNTVAGIEMALGAPGAYTLQKAKVTRETTDNLEFTTSINVTGQGSAHLTLTQDISTRDDDWYDGAAGDVFVGHSNSFIFGKGCEVELKYDGTKYYIGSTDKTTIGKTINGDFVYTQYEIENRIIPEWRQKRDSLITIVSESDYDSYTNSTNHTIYISKLKPEDENFGRDYKILWAKDDTYATDSVQWYNGQMDIWEDYLRQNEKQKVEALKNTPDNIWEYDAGAAMTHNSEFSWDAGASFSINPSLAWIRVRKYNLEEEEAGSGAELAMGFTMKVKGSLALSFDGDGGKNYAYSYTLSDPVGDNHHVIAVYGKNGFGPIFSQMGGATSRPYEGEEQTKYFAPGTIISSATTPVEMPKIICEKTTVTNVPSGKAATYEMKFVNQSAATITKPIDFIFYQENATDDDSGKAVVKVNGQPIGDEFKLWLQNDAVPYTITVEQSDPEITEIKDLHLRLLSAGDVFVYDDVYLNAYFQPAGYAVNFSTNHPVVNTRTDSILVLSAWGYNYAAKNLTAVQLQYRHASSADWQTIHSFEKGYDESQHLNNVSPLPTDSIEYTLDMKNGIMYYDDTYFFRAVTVCNSNDGQILGPSDEIKVIKDISLPKLMASPSPADGILDIGDDIHVTFNEDIVTSALRDDTNFIVTGQLNEATVSHAVALNLGGSNYASTNVPVTMAATPFTFNTWLRLTDVGSGKTTPGTLMRIGTGSVLELTTDASGVLSLSMNTTKSETVTITAEKALPLGEWLFVSVNYDNANAGSIEANCATANNDFRLFRHDNLNGSINCSGYLTIGRGITGAMNEVSIYSRHIPWATAQSEASKTKTGKEHGIMGYWSLTEGHGMQSQDLVHSRDMILSSESWYLENKNLSLHLDAKTEAMLPIAAHSVGNEDSYLIEMWVNAEQQTLEADDVTLFGIKNTGALSLGLQKQSDGSAMYLKAGEKVYTFGNMTAGTWHHVALNVLKDNNGMAAVILDGTKVLEIPSAGVPALQGDSLRIGGNFAGMIDEVRLWQGAYNASIIKQRMYERIDTTTVEGLVAYYPMESFPYDDFAQRECAFSTRSQARGACDNDVLTFTQPAGWNEAQSTPGLIPAKMKDNIAFNFVAKDNEVTLYLNENAQRLEGCIVNTTMRRYYDMNDNIGHPITWSYVVHQNHLMLDQQMLDLRCSVGNATTVGSITLTNRSGEVETWTLTDLPSWLHASQTSGVMMSGDSHTITFSMAEGTSVGRYSTTVYFTGNQQILTPLDIVLNVDGDIPDWTPQTKRYRMTVCGRLDINGIVSDDPNDIVAAFIGDECVGVAHPIYQSNMDTYFVTLNINGDKDGSTVKFSAYDASTGLVYPVVSLYDDNDNIVSTFKPNLRIGTFDQPVMFIPSSEIQQTISLHEGWNDISFYVMPTEQIPDKLLATCPKVTRIADERGNELCYDAANDKWKAPEGCEALSSVTGATWYQVYAEDDCHLVVDGQKIDPAQHTFALKANDVTYIGVPMYMSLSLPDAFASITPAVNDCVTYGNDVAMWNGDSWSGTLTTITPGCGYIYISAGTEDQTLVFPVDHAALPSKTIMASPQRYTMYVLCTIEDGLLPLGASLCAIHTDGTILGDESRVFDDDIYALAVSNKHQDGDRYHLAVRYADGTIAKSKDTYAFSAYHCLGTIADPVVIDISEIATGILNVRNADVLDNIYSVSGIRQNKPLRGINIVNGRKLTVK